MHEYRPSVPPEKGLLGLVDLRGVVTMAAKRKQRGAEMDKADHGASRRTRAEEDRFTFLSEKRLRSELSDEEAGDLAYLGAKRQGGGAWVGEISPQLSYSVHTPGPMEAEIMPLLGRGERVRAVTFAARGLDWLPWGDALWNDRLVALTNKRLLIVPPGMTRHPSYSLGRWDSLTYRGFASRFTKW
jgi:hypothetical protein